tara:strand:- start:333 stop:599 length:267 start_codon:yes stop_codon:yes gene_type:complete
MEKIIFFLLVIPIMAFVLYLGVSAILKGFTAKEANRLEKEEINREESENKFFDKNSLSDELKKLSDLREKKIITQEEFDQAKKKLLNS